jgi:hypothetical protein
VASFNQPEGSALNTTREHYADAARRLSLIWADEDDPELKDQLARLVSVYNDLANEASESKVFPHQLDARD